MKTTHTSITTGSMTEKFQFSFSARCARIDHCRQQRLPIHSVCVMGFLRGLCAGLTPLDYTHTRTHTRTHTHTQTHTHDQMQPLDDCNGEVVHGKGGTHRG